MFAATLSEVLPWHLILPNVLRPYQRCRAHAMDTIIVEQGIGFHSRSSQTFKATSDSNTL